MKNLLLLDPEVHRLLTHSYERRRLPHRPWPFVAGQHRRTLRLHPNSLPVAPPPIRDSLFAPDWEKGHA